MSGVAVSRPARDTLRREWSMPVSAALLGSTALIALYLGLVSLAQGWGHARSLLLADLWFVAPITAGFGLQVGLFVYLRGLYAATGRSAAVAGGSAGVSGTAMLACCAHHVTDLAPILGVSAAAIFLNEVKTPLALFGIAMNAAGVAYLAARTRQAKSS